MPVIAHGFSQGKIDIFTTNSLDFEDCLQSIFDFSLTTDDPIWVSF